MEAAERSTVEPPHGSPTFDGFISYSHAADDLLAPRLQAGLQRFAKPWWKRRAVRIFRDESSLAANPHLWSSITEALDDSSWFVLLLSEDAASSEWVGKEIEHWIEHKPSDRILPVVTDGTFGWDNGQVTGTSVPPALHGVFTEEPRWVDLRFAKDDENLDLKNPEFSSAVADVASTIRGIPKDELASEEVRQHRRTVRTAWAAGITVTVLAVAAVVAGLFALGQRNDARDNAALAQANATAEAEARLEADANAALAEQNAAAEAEARKEADSNAALAEARELAASAINLLEEDPELSILLTLQAIDVTPAGVEQPAEVIDALWQAVQRDRLIQVVETEVRTQDTQAGGQEDPVAVTLSPDGDTLFVIDITGLSIKAYSTSDFEELWEYQGELPPDQFFFLYFNLRASPSGRAVAFDWFGPTVSGFTVLNVDDGSELFTQSGSGGCGIGALGWTPDGRRFFVTGGDVQAPDPQFRTECQKDGLDDASAFLEILDGETFATIDLVPLPFQAGGSLDEAGRLFVFSNDDAVLILEPPDYTTQRVLEGVRGNGDVSADGSVVVTFHAPADPCFFDLVVVSQTVCGSLAVYDTATGTRLDRFEPLPSFPVDVSISGSDRFVVVPTEGATTLIWDLATGKPVYSLPSGNAINAVVSSDGTRAYTGHGGGLLKVWDLTPNVGLEPVGELGRHSLVSANTNTIGKDLGAFVAIDEAALESQVFFFDVATGELVGKPVIGQQPILGLSDDRFLITEFHEGVPFSRFLYDPMTQDRTRIDGCELDFATGLCPDGAPPTMHVWGQSFDGTQLLRVGDGARTIIDPVDGAAIGELLPAHDFQFIGGFSDEVITGSYDASFFVEDRVTGEEVAGLETAGVFDFDGGTLVFYKVDRMAIVDAVTWDIWEFPIELGLVRGMAANTELRRLAAGDENGLHVFDFDTGELLASIPIPGVSDMHWLGEDRVLVSSQTGVWATVSLLTEDLIASARDGIARGFTAAECATYRIDPCTTLEEIQSG